MSLETKQFHFGRFKLDAANSLLLDHQTPIPLAPKAFDTLVYLVRNSQRLVTRDELMKAVWPDSFVEDANVTVNISLVRKALGEMENGRPYIETVPRKGYRFNAEVLEETCSTVISHQASATPTIPGQEAGLGRGKKDGNGRDTPVRQAFADEVFSIQERGKNKEVAASARRAPSAVRPEPKPEQGLKRGWMLAGGICLVMIGLVAGWLLWRRSKQPLQFQQRRLTSFAFQGAVTAAAISTGAKFIAYANPDGLFIQVISTGDTHILQLPEPHFKVSSISWFPDSAELLIDGASPADETTSLWVVPVIGTNSPVKLGPYPPGVVSPDGSRIALLTGAGAPPQIMVMRSDGSGLHTLVTGAEGETFGAVSWLRDGKRLFFTRFRWDALLRENSGAIDSCDSSTGKTNTILAGSDFSGGVVSLPDGRIVYAKVLGANPAAYGGELLAVRTGPRTGRASGAPALIAKWPSPITDLSVNGSGNRLVVRDLIIQHDAYAGDLESGGARLVNVRRISFGVGREDFPRAWMPGSRTILLDSNRYGHWEIFKQDLGSTADEPFIQGPDDQFSPWISPDGKWVLYLGLPQNWREPMPASLMRMPVSGGRPQVVMSASGFSEWGLRFECPHRARMPCVLAQREGGHILFRPFDPLRGGLRGEKAVGRAPYFSASHFSWSLAPDGLSLAWIRWSPEDNHIHVLPLKYEAGVLAPGGTEHDVTVSGESRLHFIAVAPGGRGWYIVSQRPAGWTLLDVNPKGAASSLFTASGGFSPDVFPSPDGRHIAFSEASSRSNVWLLQNF